MYVVVNVSVCARSLSRTLVAHRHAPPRHFTHRLMSLCVTVVHSLHGPLHPETKRLEDPQDLTWKFLWDHGSSCLVCPGQGLPRPPACPSFSQMHSIRNLPSVRSREQHREDGVEDMTQLQ